MSSSDSSENANYSDNEYDMFNGAFDTPFFKGNSYMSTGKSTIQVRAPPPQPKPIVTTNQDSLPTQVNITSQGSVHLFNNTYINNYDSVASSEAQPQSNQTQLASCHVKKAILECTKVITVKQMYTVGKNIGNKWRKMAKYLPSDPPFLDGQLDAIELNKRGYDLEEVVVGVLNEWVERNDENATIGVLAKTLQDIECPHIANEIILEDEPEKEEEQQQKEDS